ncbi:MAG: 50S ribosomal protein L29 [Patescibacteria group bacterium]|nr:50S ribosomal protein L29 [Patescibacteria group bacterium]
MKRKDIQDLKLKPDAELLRLVKENSDKLRQLKFDLAAGKVKDVREIHEVKKIIARVKTFLKERTAKTA